MTATGALVLDSAGSGNLEPFAQALMSLLLRHLPSSLKNISETMEKYKTGILHPLQSLVNTRGCNFSKKMDWLMICGLKSFVF